MFFSVNNKKNLLKHFLIAIGVSFIPMVLFVVFTNSPEKLMKITAPLDPIALPLIFLGSSLFIVICYMIMAYKFSDLVKNDVKNISKTMDQ